MPFKKIRINTRSLRRKKHLTQVQMARKAHLSKTTISNLESGKQVKIELDTIAKLCEALDCTPNDLFELEHRAQENIAKKQKKSLESFIGTLEYDKKFDPKNLDLDLAKKIKK
ncbi:MAG: helix-turn-helix transcriptional regulator [Chlamydiota bacterium]